MVSCEVPPPGFGSEEPKYSVHKENPQTVVNPNPSSKNRSGSYLVNAVNAALGGGPMGVHKQRRAGKPWSLMARPRARRLAHPGLRVD